jgi:hypothetical protein
MRRFEDERTDESAEENPSLGVVTKGYSAKLFANAYHCPQLVDRRRTNCRVCGRRPKPRSGNQGLLRKAVRKWSPRTNTLLPLRFFAPTNQFAGRWHGNACGGLPPRRPLLRSLSHSFAASQSNTPAITGREIKVPRRWRRRRKARAVKPTVASHRTETERQDPLALADGCRSGPVCWGALPFLFLRR